MMLTLEVIVAALATLIAWVARACSVMGTVREALARAHEYLASMVAFTETLATSARACAP